MTRKIERIMLINPSNSMPGDSVRRIATPLGLLHIGTVLKQRGYDVCILDSPCEGYFNLTKEEGGYVKYGLSDAEVVGRIREYMPDMVGISSMFSARQRNAIHHLRLVKSVDKEIPVVLGGIHPSLAPGESIREGADYVVIGEGEYRLVEIANSLRSGKKPDCDGVAYRDNGEIRVFPMERRIQNLDEIPIPDRSLVNLEDYIKIGVPYAPFPRKERVEQVMTSRGCPFNCVFCSTVNFWGKKFRARSVENIAAELNGLREKHGIEEVQFSDDNMTVSKDRARRLFACMKGMGLSWCTPHGLMPWTLDDEMIGLMADSGAYQLTFAIESGNERVLREIIDKKVPDKDHIIALVKACQKRGIQVHGMFVVGFPGETREEIEQTLKYPYDVGFESVSYFIANPMPGSRLYEECKRKGKSRMDLKAADIIIPKDSPDYVMAPDELERLVDEETRRYNDFSRARNPEAWNKKFEQFLKRHGDKADLLLGRVT
jgi:radical SAM superfamily enzyme YgiQ (UPF0313 family)